MAIVTKDLEKVYPNLGIDSYPNLLVAPMEQPTRHALTLRSDPTFVTGWGAGNIVSDPLRDSAAEDLQAQGFGTLRARMDANLQDANLRLVGRGKGDGSTSRQSKVGSTATFASSAAMRRSASLPRRRGFARRRGFDGLMNEGA